MATADVVRAAFSRPSAQSATRPVQSVIDELVGAQAQIDAANQARATAEAALEAERGSHEKTRTALNDAQGNLTQALRAEGDAKAALVRTETLLAAEREALRLERTKEDGAPLKTRIAVLEAELTAERAALVEANRQSAEKDRQHTAALAAIPKAPPLAQSKDPPPAALEFVVTARDANGDIKKGSLKVKT